MKLYKICCRVRLKYIESNYLNYSLHSFCNIYIWIIDFSQVLQLSSRLPSKPVVRFADPVSTFEGCCENRRRASLQQTPTMILSHIGKDGNKRTIPCTATTSNKLGIGSDQFINIPTITDYSLGVDSRNSLATHSYHQQYTTSNIVSTSTNACNCVASQHNSAIINRELYIDNRLNTSIHNRIPETLHLIPRSVQRQQSTGTACYIATELPETSYMDEAKSSTLPRNASASSHSSQGLNANGGRKKSLTTSAYADQCFVSNTLPKSSSVSELAYSQDSPMSPELLGRVPTNKNSCRQPSPTYINTLIEA